MKTTYNSLRRKNKTTIILKTGRFDNTDSAVFISNISKAVPYFTLHGSTLHYLAYTADDDS